MAHSSIYDFEALSIEGKPAHLSTQRGKVLLIVNTASACGFTPQFGGLEQLWKDYRDRGLVIVGFPSNEFGGQDPGSNDEIASFCELNYGVSFPMMAKVEVNGAEGAPAVEVAHQRGAAAAGHAGGEVELHQVPRRPRRQGAQALRPERRARIAAQRHRSRAGGLNCTHVLAHRTLRRRPHPQPQRGLPEGPAAAQDQPVDRHLLRRCRAHPGARVGAAAPRRRWSRPAAPSPTCRSRARRTSAARCRRCCSAPSTRP